MSCKKGFRKFVLCNFRQISRLPSEKCLLQPSIRHCCQAPCEVVYPFLIMASTKPQKLLFRGVPGGPLWSEYVTTTNFHYQPLFFREILYFLIRNKINTSELQFRKSRSTVPKTTYFLPLGPHNDIFQKSGDNVRFLIGELLLWLIVGIASSFGSGGESRAGCVYTLVSIRVA